MKCEYVWIIMIAEDIPIFVSLRHGLATFETIGLPVFTLCPLRLGGKTVLMQYENESGHITWMWPAFRRI